MGFVEGTTGVCEGDVLGGKYRIEQVLGVGGMGVVVSARHLQLETKVAIKFLLPEMLSNGEIVSRFAREARAAVRITGEHVARVLDVGTLETGAPYMVMEFLEGGDLAALLRQQGTLPVDQALEFVLQACIAVAEAHSLGIVHRDLKPANLFCIRRADGKASIKVLDFGISKLTDPSAEGGVSVTKSSALMGSPLYMSPEQMRSTKDVDAQTDVWALGVILCELLTGRTPFHGETVTEVAIKVATVAPDPPSAARPDIPPGLDAVILGAIEKDKEKRYRSVAELAIALRPFLPARTKLLVERICGILQVPHLGSVAPKPIVPPVPTEPIALAATMTALERTTEAPTRSGKRVAALAMVGGAGALGAVALAAFVMGRTPAGVPRASAGVTVTAERAVSAAPLEPAAVAPLPSAAIAAEPDPAQPAKAPAAPRSKNAPNAARAPQPRPPTARTAPPQPQPVAAPAQAPAPRSPPPEPQKNSLDLGNFQ